MEKTENHGSAEYLIPAYLLLNILAVYPLYLRFLPIIIVFMSLNEKAFF